MSLRKIWLLLAAAAMFAACLSPLQAAGNSKKRVHYRKRAMQNKLPCAPIAEEALKRIESARYYKVVVFGASNTERYMPSLHWSDILDVGLREKYTRKFHMINSGRSGNNTVDALGRFDRDVAAFQPDIVIVTLGGNDCNPKPGRFVSEDDFNKNMDLIIKKIRDLGALPILQTYYKMDLAAMEPERAEKFVRYMELVRQAAERNKVFLVDQYRYFEAVSPDVLRYKLLINAMHTNETGNALMGVILLKHLGIDAEDLPHNESLRPALAIYHEIAE